jgi:addiction module HigA family antidote
MSGFIVPTGNIIKEYIDERKISQKELSQRIDASERHLSQLLNGKTRLTEEMALKLEKVMSDVPASYWLNYEAKYQEYLAREKEKAALDNLDLKEIAKRFHFSEVFRKANLSLVDQAIEMLKLLGVSNFSQYKNSIAKRAIAFMEDGGEPEAMIVWLRLCEEEAEDQNKDLAGIAYSKKALEQSLGKLKRIASNDDADASIKSCRKLLNQLGIYLIIRPALVNAKIRGAIDIINGHPAIIISGRYKTHDIVWFAIIHEIAHLLLHYDPKQQLIFVDNEEDGTDIEAEANAFARSFFVSAGDYGDFKKNSDIQRDVEIRRFAKEQGVAVGVIVGFLEFDGCLPYGAKSYLKTRIQV